MGNNNTKKAEKYLDFHAIRQTTPFTQYNQGYYSLTAPLPPGYQLPVANDSYFHNYDPSDFTHFDQNAITPSDAPKFQKGYSFHTYPGTNLIIGNGIGTNLVVSSGGKPNHLESMIP